MNNSIVDDTSPAELTSLNPHPVTNNKNSIYVIREIVGKCIPFALLILVFSSPAVTPHINLWIILGAVGCAVADKYRLLALTVGTFVVLCTAPSWFEHNITTFIATQEGLLDTLNITAINYSMLIFFVLFSLTLMMYVRRYQHVNLCKRPVRNLLLFFAILLVLASSQWLQGIYRVMLWSFISVFSAYFWFLCYALAEQESQDPSPFWLRLGMFHPFYGSTTTPYGKGADYLRKYTATTPDALATSQRRGIQLLLWCIVIQLVAAAFVKVTHGTLHIPQFSDCFARQAQGEPYPWYLCWGTLITAFFESIFFMVGVTNIPIAIARIAGFALPRNSHRVLQSRTIAEFWGRYYFYFKELLAELFFYPTFFCCFQQHKKLRIWFATFMAAGVGNLLFHFMRDIYNVAFMGLTNTLIHFQTYAFYCLVLSTAIAFSQIRSMETRKPFQNRFLNAILPPLSTGFFFCMIEIFDPPCQAGPLTEHFYFLFHLFGLA